MGGTGLAMQHEAQLSAVRAEIKATIDSCSLKLSDQAKAYQGELKEGEERRAELEAHQVLLQVPYEPL